MFPFILIIGGIVLYFLSNSQTINIPKWVGMAIAGVGLLLLLLGRNSFLSGNTQTPAPAQTGTKDSCGCYPGQNVALLRKNIWGKYKPAGAVPCAQAQARLSNKRFSLGGCVNPAA